MDTVDNSVDNTEAPAEVFGYEETVDEAGDGQDPDETVTVTI